jgi:hypothetical protein
VFGAKDPEDFMKTFWEGWGLSKCKGGDPGQRKWHSQLRDQLV